MTYLHLFAGGDGTEYNLGKVLCGERSETDSSNHSVLFYQGQGMVLSARGQGTEIN